ncbi:MAG TPA: hypothetical protein VFO49_05955 [Nocardioides sp.]|nr:hypothetical protein [Nocardioides sp.]
MSETLYGVEARMREVEMRRHDAARRAGRGHPAPPTAPSRHRLAERLRRVADRLDG